MRVCAFAALAAAMVGPASARLRGSTDMSLPAPPAYGEGSMVTNVCNLDWNYCPRDPGCKTYTMSVHSVVFHANGKTAPIKAEDLKVGDSITMVVTGLTTITKMPDQGSYKIYGLSGHNIAAGALSDVFTLNAPNFGITVTFTLTADAFGQDEWFEVGLDVFQEASGSDEGFCINVEDIEFLAYEKSKPDPPFEMLCKDNGDGTFTPDIVPLKGHPLPAPNCNGPACDLKWYYCPRDPGCITYTMTVNSVVVDVADTSGIKVGDHILMHVNGTTSLRSVPTAGSYRIYGLDGKNVATGVLTNVMSLSDCNSEGCHFGLNIGFVLPPGCFTSQGWFEYGLDVFQKKSGSDEGMCIEVVNPTYLHYEETTPQPPPGFVMLCEPGAYGHFTSKTIPEPVENVDCVLQ